MKKHLRLMLALLTFTLGWTNASAQTDVTSQYITNADFEGEYIVYSNPKSDRAIYQPSGWTVTYTNGDENDLTSLNSLCTQWNNFSNRQQPTNGDNNTYWIRYRWGSNACINLSQTTTELPKGVYHLSFDAFNTNASQAKAIISVAGKSVEINDRNTWANYGVVFTLQEASTVTITYSYQQIAQAECIAGIDNFKLIDLTQGASDITFQDWTTAIANAGFERGTNGSSVNAFNLPYGFTFDNVADGWRDGSINTTNPSEGSKLYNLWAGTTTSLDMYQKLMLPAGKYTISADLRTEDGRISNQGVYAKIGDNIYKSGTITTIGDPWNGVDAWNTLSKDFYVDAEGTVQLGASSTGGANSVGWFQIDNFKLTYKGAVQNTPYFITPETATEIGANKWYAVNISTDGEYKIISSAANTVKYTQRGALIPSDVTDNLSFTANETKVISLNKGTLYLVATNDATLTVAPNSYSYSMGTPTTSVADNDYTQNNVLTVTFADAVTNDPSGVISILDDNKIKVNGTKATASISDNVLTITLAETLATSSDYDVSIEAGAVGYNRDNTNEAFSLTVKTPALFDGMYFIATTDGKQYISRGGDSNTEAALDNFGIAANFTTDEKNITHIAFVDNNKNLFGGSESVYTDKNETDLGDDAGRTRWTLAAVDGGGYTLYNNQWSKYIAAGTGIESKVAAAVYSDAAYTWTLEATTAHPAKMTALKNANAENAATAAGITASTPADLNAIIEDTNTYKATSITLSNNYSTIDEQYQGYGNVIPKQTINGLAKGLYKVTLYGFQRITNNANTYNYSLVGADNPTAYIYANDEKVQMLSPMSQSRTTAYGEGWPNYSPEEGKNYPNNQDAAGTAYTEGMYKNEVFVYVSDGTLDIGVYSPAKYQNANWISYRDLSVTLYKSYKSSWEEAKAVAESAIADDAYENVLGSEKIALQTEIDKAEPTTAEGYEEATLALTNATKAFIEAKPNYDALVAEIGYAKTINVNTTTAEAAINEEATSENVLIATQALKVLEYNTISTVYPKEVTSMLGTWGKGNYDTTSGQGYAGNETYFDKWSGNSAELTSSATVTLPAGNYVIKVAGRGESSTSMNLSVKVGDTETISTPFFMNGDKGYGIDTNGATNFSTEGTYSNNNLGRGWQYRYITFSTDGTSEIVVSINGHLNNGTWQSFYAPILLCDDDTYASIELDAAKAELKAAIDAVVVPTANVGDAAFQIPTAQVNAATQAKAVAQDVYDNAATTKEEAETAKTTLEAAIANLDFVTLNAPADGQLFNVILTYGGWTYDQKAMTYLAGDRNDMGGYNIKYTAEANSNLAQAFTFTKVEGNNYKMSQIDADGNVRYMSTGFPHGGNNNQIRTTTNADDAMIVTVIPTSTEGVWNLKNVAANNYIGSQDAGVFTVNSHIDFNIVETTKPSITINTTSAGWGTTILPFAAQKPANVKVYSCAAVDGSTLNLVEVDALEANKPYIIEGSWKETLTGDAQGTALTYSEGYLTGVYTKTDAPVGSYVLQKQNDVVGFYKVAEGKQPTVGANRAYLQVASEAKMFSIGGDATGISAIEALLNGDAEIYNVSGVKQNSLQKGMNIIKLGDGTTQKVMVK